MRRTMHRLVPVAIVVSALVIPPTVWAAELPTGNTAQSASDAKPTQATIGVPAMLVDKPPGQRITPDTDAGRKIALNLATLALLLSALH